MSKMTIRPGTNPIWEDFLDSIEIGKAYSKSEFFTTYENDYRACKRDFEKGVPRAVELMVAFAKFRLKS